MAHCLSFAYVILQALTVVTGQTILEEHVWATVSYTLYGDRTPLVLPDTSTLTPFGAQQLYQAGSRFRDRYVDPPSDYLNPKSTIESISRYQLNADDIAIVSTSDQFSVASAQAFMQGLFPPLANSTNYTFINGQSQLADGSNIEFPLNGYQYPPLYTASPYDENSVWIAGHVNCPMWDSSRSDYYSSAEYETLLNANQDFYKSLQPKILDGVFLNASVGYFDAYYIYDYLSYGAVHNSTINKTLDSAMLDRAHALASSWVVATSGNSTRSGSYSGDHISTVAGRSLATQLLSALSSNIEWAGEYNKMTLMFGSYEPMVGFFSLADLLTPQTAQFYGLPLPGSTMIFELFSFASSSDSNTTLSFPSTDDLNIRFLFQNGTSADPVAFPLFSHSPSRTTIPLSEFTAALQSFMILSVQDWCTTCSSAADFCLTNSSATSPSSGSSGASSSSSRHGLNPAVAGVIGAIVALIVASLSLGLAMLLFGVRFYRVHKKRRSHLNGFKGGEKLASDQDLAIAKNGAPNPIGASVVKSGAGETAAPAPRGHERVGSWEMGSQAKAKEAAIPGMPLPPEPTKRPSFEGDDDDDRGLYARPLKVDERV